ncbi:hypothetical protein DFR66_110118 [Flavobacterium glaciei]|uniref:Uncharacterized protein n=1 Tax=Flavobacterium glaciei TaxID=386300 RepID=A0ABX9HWH9_9FLAO|nr:hypothetical protein DFR66_110118 [Flavobacterium glaciei]
MRKEDIYLKKKYDIGWLKISVFIFKDTFLFKIF